MSLTLPTGTPEIRTSASWASCVASPKETLKRQPLALSGVGPPKASHRNSSRPKHDSAKPTMTRILPRLGTCLFTPRSPARVRVRGLRRRRADLVLGRRVGQADDRAQLRVDGLELVQQAQALAAEE